MKTLAISVLSFAVAPAAFAQDGLPEGSLTGRAAVESVGDRLSRVAARHGWTAEEFAAELLRDRSLHLTPAGDLFYVCRTGVEDHAGAHAWTEPLGDPGIPLDSFMSLHSRPGAPKTVYLDIDGHLSADNAWGHTIDFPAWDTDGDPASFSDDERREIIWHWLEVAEDFAVFDINVTTQDPGPEALTRVGADDETFGMRVVLTQRTDGFGDGIGGIAWRWSFNQSIDTPCFTFNKGVPKGSVTSSHEVGHTLGLKHHGLRGLEYHPGTDGTPSWGPIMGAPFSGTLLQWSDGDYDGATREADHIALITTENINRVAFVPDDHPGSDVEGTPLELGVPAAGLINDRFDTDSFRFTSDGGAYTLRVKTPVRRANLDASVRIVRADPISVVDELDPAGTTDIEAVIDLSPAGDYIFVVDGSFEQQTDGARSDYGSIGTFEISVDAAPCPADANGDGQLSPNDFNAWILAFSNGAPACDQNGDGECRPNDFNAWIRNFNAGC
ncbi:MAG: GC-type dockerin domain-anchored protein [Planctomycetota bacterium]